MARIRYTPTAGPLRLPTGTDFDSDHPQQYGQTKAHRVTISVIDLLVDLQWVSVPREAPSAFLQAKVKNTSQFLLLPSNANIFLENNFVAKSTIQ